jgi:hypothetical protein
MTSHAAGCDASAQHAGPAELSGARIRRGLFQNVNVTGSL